MTKTGLGFRRRDALETGAGALALGLLGAPLVARHALGQSKFDWKRFSGQKIDVMLVKNPRSDLLQAAEKEFSAATGNAVSSEQIPEQQQRQKTVIEFTSGKPTFDVVQISMHVQKRQLKKGNWLTDVKPYIADATMTAPDWDFADFGKGAPPCGSTASASPRRSRTRPSRASSARSATASCRRARRRITSRSAGCCAPCSSCR